MKTKVCTKCGEEKEATSEFFHKQQGGKYGLKAICSVCSVEIHKKWCSKNKDKIAERMKEYYSKNKDKITEYKKEYRSENKEKIAERTKEYQSKNKDKIAERMKEYRESLSDSYVASRMKISVKDVPPKILETKRLTILLKRELNK